MAQRHQYKVYFLLLLLSLVLLFSFMTAVLSPGFNFIDLGISNAAENLLVAIFSFFTLLLIVYNLFTL
ncbi:MAG: hypothetical protein Q8R37_05515 [Nanoarchaeota archaeon]|nr:hypothetical protein [Nanoarchaeota archaeon]